MQDDFWLATIMKSIGAICSLEPGSNFNEWMMNVLLSFLPGLRGRIRALAVFMICTRRRSTILNYLEVP